MEWLYHKKPLFLMHWKDGKVPQSVQDKVVVIPGGDALKSPIALYHETTSAPATPKASQIVHQHARSGSSWKTPCTMDHCNGCSHLQSPRRTRKYLHAQGVALVVHTGGSCTLIDPHVR